MSSRVDEKGRLKLPVEIQRYLESTDAKDVFITSFEGRIARIYSIPEWEVAEALLESPAEDAIDGADLHYKAQYYGADAQIDGQGRLLMPTTLRRAMGVENQPVLLSFIRGHIEVFSQAVHEQKMGRAEQDADEKLTKFVNRGLR